MKRSFSFFDTTKRDISNKLPMYQKQQTPLLSIQKLSTILYSFIELDNIGTKEKINMNGTETDVAFI